MHLTPEGGPPYCPGGARPGGGSTASSAQAPGWVSRPLRIRHSQGAAHCRGPGRGRVHSSHISRLHHSPDPGAAPATWDPGSARLPGDPASWLLTRPPSPGPLGTALTRAFIGHGAGRCVPAVSPAQAPHKETRSLWLLGEVPGGKGRSGQCPARRTRHLLSWCPLGVGVRPSSTRHQRLCPSDTLSPGPSHLCPRRLRVSPCVRSRVASPGHTVAAEHRTQASLRHTCDLDGAFRLGPCREGPGVRHPFLLLRTRARFGRTPHSVLLSLPRPGRRGRHPGLRGD